MKQQIFKWFAFPVAAAIAMGCNGSLTTNATESETAQPGAPASKSIAAIASATADFSTLVAAAQAAGLVGVLNGPGSYTVFAPTNAAFAKLPEGTVSALLEPANKGKLAAILKYHLLPAAVFSKDVKSGEVTTIDGEKLTIARAGSSISITDQSGNTAAVTQADIGATNGVIHVIDRVLLPTAPKANNIPDVAAAAGSFKTLLTAVQAAGLGATLSAKGPFTVFAPTDEAFAKLPAGTVETLLKPENKATLAKILTYHVVAAKVPAADVKSGNIDMVSGDALTVSAKNGKVALTDGKGNVVNVIKTDIMADNGIIHVIDGVLLPE